MNEVNRCDVLSDCQGTVNTLTVLTDNAAIDQLVGTRCDGLRASKKVAN